MSERLQTAKEWLKETGDDASRVGEGLNDELMTFAQFQKAIKGDNTQLIWLGKQRLGQREPRDIIDHGLNPAQRAIISQENSNDN